MRAESRRPEADATVDGKDSSGRFVAGNAMGRRFPKGVSGNPGGLPAWVREARELAAADASRAIARLSELIDHVDPRVAIVAAQAILDRAGVRPFALPIEATEPCPACAARGEELSQLSIEELERIIGPPQPIQK